MIKIFKTKFNKLIALLTTTSLLISFVVGPTAASAINNDQTAKEYSQIFKEFILPYSYGKITKSHFAGTDRVIINIQDLHCHPKVQKNIANIIETFDNKYGVNNIYLEGAYGDVSTKWITDQIKKDNNLLEKMMDTGRLTGAEYYSALSGKTEIIKGLEEKEPYLDNITRLGSILDSQEKIDLILKSLDESVNEVKKKYYTKRQYKIEHLFKEYKDGKINSQKYYALLSKHIDKLGIDLTKYENTLIYVTLLNSQKDLNYKQITKELQSLISILKQQLPYNAYRALLENTSNFQEVEKLYSYIIQLDKVYNLDISLKFTELDKYFKYIELSKKINPVELVKEDEFLSQEINTRFSQTPAQKDVVFLVHFGRYLRDYVTTKITLEDYKYYKENIEQYRKIYNKYVDNRVLSLLDEYIAQIDKFYEINMDRNLYFTKNMFEENELVQIEQVKQAFDDINKIISNMDEVKRVDVVVTGGFHSQTVTELLEQQNVSYIVITPNVTDGIKLAEETYYELAKEQSKISFQTIAPLIASLSPQLQAILLNKIESEDTEKIEQIMKMDEAERAQTIADLAAAKLLESDDLGNLKETLNEIVKNLVDEYHKEKVTSELVSEIKNLQSLLKNKENLQKVIDLLSEGTVKQSVILVNDMFDDIYEQLFGIFPSFADKDKLEPRDAKSPRKYFEEDIEKYSIYKIQDEDYYGYDIFDSLDIWFSGEELILSREIIEQSNFNEDLERFIGYLGQNNIADYELLNKILTVLKSINEEDRKNGFCGILHAVIDEGTNKIDKEQALKAKEKILSFLEIPTQLQFEICDLFSIVDLDYNENTEKTFFDALLDVINKDGYKNIDIDFLFEVVDNSRLIAELETRENLYDFLTLSIEKRRLIYNFYKSSENNFDIGINQLTLNFIISVLNKYNFTDEQFNYIMELICSINLKDDKDGKAYIDNLKDKEINLLVLDQVKYLRIYNRYMMNLIFSDIDRKNIQIIIPNLQKIIELFDGLQKYQIDTLETENKGFALVLFSSVKFKEYCEKNKITDITKQYQLAIRITRRIHSITGDKFFTLSYTKTEKIIERTLKYYDTIKQIVSILTLFTNKTAVFSLHNGERNDDGSGFRFTPAGLKKVLEILDIKPEIFEVIEISFLDKVLDFIKGIEQDEIDTQTLLDFVNSLDGSVIVKNGIIKDLSHKKKISKNEFIEHLNSLKSTEYFVEVNRLLRVIEHFNEYKQDKGVFIFDGHGHDESFSYSENGALTVKQISKALINAYNNGVDLKNITLMFESCHSYDFADNIINELRANGITSFPQIITDAGRETIYGYTNSIDIDGTTIRVSNLFYSLLKFLKLKTEEELKQMKGRLTFKDIADAPRYLSNNTMFVTNQQVIEENSKLEADIIDIINEQDAEDIETVTAKNDIAYAGTYKVYSELTTWLSKLILKIRGLDAKSVEGQELINRLENWQILLGIFFPAIKNMFVGMHGEENREGVEQGLASVFDRIGETFKSAVNVTIEEASGLSFAKKLTNFVIALQNPDLMKELAEAHKEWNLGVQRDLSKAEDEEIIVEDSEQERQNIVGEKEQEQFVPQQKWAMNNISKEAPYIEKYNLVYYIFEQICRKLDVVFPEEMEHSIINRVINAYDSSFREIIDFWDWVHDHLISDIMDFQTKQIILKEKLDDCSSGDIKDILWIFSQYLAELESNTSLFDPSLVNLDNIISVANGLKNANNIVFSKEVYAVLEVLADDNYNYKIAEAEQIFINIGLIQIPNALYKKTMEERQFKQLEESIRENENRKMIVISEMMLPSTREKLEQIGNKGIIKSVYKDKAGKNFRFTTFGVALGVLIETFKFWRSDFIKSHNFDPSIQAGMTAVVWTVRALSIGIGIWTGSILALFLAETITHFIWNYFVIKIGRKDLLLQTSESVTKEQMIAGILSNIADDYFDDDDEWIELEELLNNDKIHERDLTFIFENPTFFTGNATVNYEKIKFFFTAILSLRQKNLNIDDDIYEQVVLLIDDMTYITNEDGYFLTKITPINENLIFRFINLNRESKQIFHRILTGNVKTNTLELMLKTAEECEKADCTQQEINDILSLIIKNRKAMEEYYFKELQRKILNINLLRFYLSQKNKPATFTELIDTTLYRERQQKFDSPLWLSVLYSDININSVIGNDNGKLESLFNLMRSLEGNKIMMLDTEYRGLALKIFLNEEFRRNIQLQYEMEEKEGTLIDAYRIAQKISRTLYNAMGNKVLDLENKNLDSIIERLISDNLERRSIARKTSLVSEMTGVIAIHNNERYKNQARYSLKGIETVMRLMGITPKLKTDLVVENKNDAEDKSKEWLLYIENFLDLLRQKGLTNIRYVFDGHSDDNKLYLNGKNGVSITAEQLAEALFNAYKKCHEQGEGEKFEDLILDLSCCCSYNFAKKVINRLKELELEQTDFQDLPLRFPQIVTEAGKETEIGYSTWYTDDTTGEKFLVSNMEYSLIQYIKNAKEKNQTISNITLQDLFDAQIYKANHTIFISNAEIEKCNREIRQYLAETLGGDFVLSEQDDGLPEDILPIRISELMSISTRERLDNWGKTKIVKRIFKERSGKNFKYTTAGIIIGVLMETFSFWKIFSINVKVFGKERKVKNFMEEHENPTMGQKIVVWVIRMLSVGLGFGFGIASFGSGILALFLTETITHFIWNYFVIKIGRKDLLLQTSEQSQDKKTVQVTVPTVKTKEKAKELTKEQQQELKKALSKTKVRIKNSTLEIVDENDKNLSKELQEIFNDLLDSMVKLGKITEEEKKDYELILYLSDEVNAFTVSGSKTVFISTGMLRAFSLYLQRIVMRNGKVSSEDDLELFGYSKYMNKQEKQLCRDHIAAILAHELEHTIQDRRVYKGFLSTKGDQKKNEYDSDIQAIFMLDNAGYNPMSVQELMEFLVFIEQKEKYNSLFSTILDAHPDAENRLTKIKSFLSDRNIFLRSSANNMKDLESSVPYYGEDNLSSDVVGKLGYAKRDSVPQDSKGFVKEILEKYGDKIALYKILDLFNSSKHFVDVNDVLNYINSVEYPFFNDTIKNFNDNQKKVIFRLMNSFDGHYPSNAEIYELCPNMNELKEIFDFIIEPENYLFFFKKISFLNISYLVAALYNSGNLREKDYDKIQKFLSVNEDSFVGHSSFLVNVDKDTFDFYIDNFEIFNNLEKYHLYRSLRDVYSNKNNFSENQKEKFRTFSLTPSKGGIGAYHMFGGSKFFELLYSEMTLEDYISSITEEEKQKILEDAEKKEIEDYNSFTQARNREVLGEKYDPSKEPPGVTSMYEIYKRSNYAKKKFEEKNGSRWNVPYEDREDNWHEIWDEKERKWLSENDDALFAEWLQNKKEEWFLDICLRKYNSLLFERYESELVSKLSTLEEKLEFVFPGNLMEFDSRISARIDYEASILKVLKKNIESIKSKEELFKFIDDIDNYFEKENSIQKTKLNETIYIVLSNVDRKVINNLSIKDIQKLFELSMLKEMSDVTCLMSVALILKRKNPKSVLNFDEIFSISDYRYEKHKEAASDFVENVIDEEQLRFLFGICHERDLSLRDVLRYDICDKIAEKFDESISLEEKYRYSIYKDKVYPYKVYQKIKNEEDLKKIPIEHLKRFLGIEVISGMGAGRLGLENSFALRIWQNKVEQYQQNFGKSFYDTKNFSEFSEKIKEIEEVFYPWKNQNADNQNAIFSNEVDMLWANLLHNMCGFGLETRSFVFVNIHGEELLNVWCELTPNEDFIPTAQQVNELLEAFSLVKDYLPSEEVIAYAKMLYELIKKNKDLSVFESVEKNLELVDFLFEGFSEIKDDYIYELLENYDIDFTTYNKCLSKTLFYSYRDNTENTNKNFLYRDLAVALSKGNMSVEDKIKFIAWLISDKQDKPDFLKRISVINDYGFDSRGTSLGEDAKIDIIRNYFWSMTKSERTEFIRELLADILKEGFNGKGNDYKKLKDTLADAFFDSVRNDNNGKIVDALKESFKIILDSLVSYENKSTNERQILFISDLTDSLSSISKSKFSPEEKEARQIGRFIFAMGAASGVAVVKILQILSNSRAFEALGDQGFIINEEISKVRSSNEQLSKRVVFQQLDVLGILEDVESVGKCLGSASIGVTYLINMKDGSKRIIKIKRPSVLKNYEQDLKIAEGLIDLFKFSNILQPDNKNMIPTIDFLKQVFDTELNFEDEVNNLLKAKNNLSKTAINTPDVVGNYNVDSFMQTLSSGQSLDNAKLKYSEQERSEIYSKVLLEFFREVFMDGFFHADLHEGNIFVDEDQNITFIDWGACGYVKEAKRDDLEAVFIALLLSDSIGFMDALKQYDIELYTKTSDKSEEIVKILDSNDNLETKFGRIFTIFNQLDMSQNHDFLMFIQGLSKIAKYIDNLSVKEQILLLLDDTVIYDLLRNKQVLSNFPGLIEKTFTNRYSKLAKFVIKKLVNLDNESLQNIITDIRLFIASSDDNSLDRLVRNLLKVLHISSAFEKPLKFLISKKIKQLSDLPIKRNKQSVKGKEKNHFKVLDFIKERFFNKTKIKKAEIEFTEESKPVVFLIQRNGVQYTLTMDFDVIILDRDSSENHIDIGMKYRKLFVYLSSKEGEYFSRETSEYKSIDSIENLLGIKIDIDTSNNTISVISEDNQTDIKYVRHEDISEIISNLKGHPIDSSQEEDENIKKDSGCDRVEKIFLDQDVELNETKIETAVGDNYNKYGNKKALFALYPFSNVYDIDSLSEEQLTALYLQLYKYFNDIARILSSEKHFDRIYENEVDAIRYSMLELIKKAFIMGNASLSKPIYVSCTYEGSGYPTFTVYRKLGNETTNEKQMNFAAVINGTDVWAKPIQYYQENKLINVTPQEKTIREIGGNREKYYSSTITKEFQIYYDEYSKWGDDYDMFDDIFDEFEQELEERERALSEKNEEILKKAPGLPSTQELLDRLGNIGIVKRIYKDNAGVNFKFTRLGVAAGSIIEVIPFFLPTFINDHNFDSSVKTKMIAVVWVIRALTIGIGFVTGSIQIAILSNIIIHSVWNRFVILIGRQDLLLQLSKQKSTNEEATISNETKNQSDFSSLMSRVFDNIEIIENINGRFESDRVTAQKEAEAELMKIFTAEELETIDLLASVIFDSIKYVNSTRNTSSIEFVNIAYALKNGLFNSNLLPKEGEDLKQHILDMLRHYIEVSKQKKGEDNLLVKIVNSNENLLNDMVDYLADIILKNNLVEKAKIEKEKRKTNMQNFIDGVKGDDKLFSAVMICSANENRSAIWHIMFKDFLEKHNKRNTKVFSAGVFYDISQRFMNEEKTDKTKPLVEDYIETLSSDERYKNINENLRDGFRSRYIEYLNLPKNSQPVFIVAGEQHRAQLIKLGYDSSWIFLMSDFYSDEFKKEFKKKNKVLGQQLEDNNIFSMSEFPDPFENQILRQDLPELVRSVVEYSFEGEPTQHQLPEEIRNLADDYNQFEHMENLPDFAGTNDEEEKRQNAIELFNDQLENIVSQKNQFIFRGNTKYLYLLQNRKNKYILLNIASQPSIDLKFRLFALLYLDKLRHELTSEETTRVAQTEEAIVKRLKKQIENNEFEVLNNLDLRAYMMGVYLILRDYADKISVPDIINRAIIINPYGKTMARDDGLFAEVDLFIVIHELAHRIFYKPQNRNEYVSVPLDELVSYIVPNMFLRKIMNLPFEAYSKSQNLYTIHHSDGVIDYIKMGRKFHSLYSMFDKNAENYNFKQEEHSAPIAFLDYLFAVHQKAGKPIDWDVLLDVIRDLSLNKLDQLKMFRRILDLYMKRSIEKGSLTKEETEVMKKEIEEMQVWTILVREVIEIIESTSPNTFNLLKGNKDASVYKTEILSKTKEMKESFKEILNAFTWNVEFSKSELLVLLIMNVMKNVEYEQLENNFDGVINGIIDVINKASGELKLALNKDKYSPQEYRQILNFVLMNYTISKHVETSVTNDIYTYISKNLDYLSFTTKLINMVFGTRDLTKIFSNKKLLVATSKQQEEKFKELLSDREENDIAVVTMEIIRDRVYDMRGGIFLDVQKGIKATYDSKENKIIVYSKEGINITEDEIKNKIKEQYFSERKDDSFDDVIAFADEKVKSLQDITDRLNIAYTESVSIPNKETTFDLSSRIFMKNIVNVCEQESKATGIKTFIITFDQAKEFTNEIQALQERDFKFIVSCKIDAISNIKYYDGLIIDDSKTDYEDISQLLPVMEKVRKHVLKAGVAKPVSVKFSNPTYGQFNSAGINIFDTYGMLPIVEDSYITNSMKGKFVVEKIRDNNIERFLRQNNVVGFVIDNARTFADKKSKLRDLFSKEHKYSKGYNAALSSKFDYTCTKVELLTKYLAIEIDNDKDLKETDKQILDELTTILLDDKHSSELKSSLSFDSKAYLKYLGSKGRYEEMTGFIRGIAMNSARAQIVKGLEEKGFNLNMNKFANVADGKYQKAFLTIAVQLMMEDIDITELLETGFIDSDMTAKEYLDSVLEKVNINIEEILKKNEYKIEKIEKKDIPKTIEDFKNYVVLLDNLKIIKDTTAGLDMSIKAVRSMLSAA